VAAARTCAYSHQGKRQAGYTGYERSRFVKLFHLEAYDDAELDRKKTAALFTAFCIGQGETPILHGEDDEDEPLPCSLALLTTVMCACPPRPRSAAPMNRSSTATF